MNDSDYEGKCLSEQFGVGGPPEVREDAPPPVRTVETVTLEIRTLQRQAQQVVLGYAIEIGRRLEEVKAMLPHGRWGDYLKHEVEYSQSTAQNFMRIFREYGASQQSLFGCEANSQALGNLTYTKALQLLAIPDKDERETFVLENDVEHMSVRELNEALKARDEAEEKAAAAQKETATVREELEAAQKELDWKEKAINQQQEALDRQTQKARQLQDALSKANASAQSAGEEHDRLLQELEELRSRPVDVAVEVDQEAVEAARQAAIAEMTEKVNKANDKAKKANKQRKNFEENLAAAQKDLAAAQKELADLKAREPQVRELQAMTADAVEKARAGDLEKVKELEKKLSAADRDTSEFMLISQMWQNNYIEMMKRVDRIESEDSEKGKKLRNGVNLVVKGWLQDES